MTTYALSNGGQRNPVFYVSDDGKKLTTQDSVVDLLSKLKKTKDWQKKENLTTTFLFVPLGTKPEDVEHTSVRKKCPNAKVVTLDSVFSKRSNMYSFRLHLDNGKHMTVYSELPVDPSFFHEHKEKQTKESYVAAFGVWKSSRKATAVRFCLPVPTIRTVHAIDVCQDVDVAFSQMPSRPFEGKDFQMMVETQTDSNQQLTALRYSLTWLTAKPPTPIKRDPRFEVFQRGDKVDLKIYSYQDCDYKALFPYSTEVGWTAETLPSQTTVTIPQKHLKTAIATLQSKGYRNS